jgi:6-phosphogluconolactonase
MEVPVKILVLAGLLLVVAGASAENRFVYVNNQSQPNTITAFQINPDGTLIQLSNSPFSTGGNGAEGPIESMAVVFAAAGPILYAANGGDPSISALIIDPKTGTLTPAAGSPLLVNDSAGTYDMAASPNGRFLFVTNESNSIIHVFAIAPATGRLTEIQGSPFAAGANISGLYVTANGKFLLAAGNSISAVEVFAIASSGVITQVPGSPFAANASVSDVRSNCAGNRVFTADNGSDLVDAYVMSADGALTAVPGSPFYNGATGNGPNSFDLAIDPNGGFLFTTDSFSDDITSFAIAPNGALSQVDGSPFDTSGWLGGAAITNRGDFLYSVGFADGSLNAEAIRTDGTLTDLGGFSGGQISANGEPNSVIAYPPPACPSTVAQ